MVDLKFSEINVKTSVDTIKKIKTIPTYKVTIREAKRKWLEGNACA